MMAFVFVFLTFIFVLAWLLLELLFFFTHRKPLTEAEMILLAELRKRRYIGRVFRFPHSAIAIDKSFKSSLSPSGAWYAVSVPLANFPSYVAALLKGKKHEWIVLGIVKEETVVCFWANKGQNNASVAFRCEPNEIVLACKAKGGHTVLCLHNHPNPDPQHYNCLSASQQDKISAQELAQAAALRGVNWLEFSKLLHTQGYMP